MSEMLTELENEYARMEELVVQIDPSLTDVFAQRKAERLRKQQEREALIKECHPNGDHWPPHEKCPACQKILQMVENLARRRCVNPEDQTELEKHFWQIMQERYGVVLKEEDNGA